MPVDVPPSHSQLALPSRLQSNSVKQEISRRSLANGSCRSFVVRGKESGVARYAACLVAPSTLQCLLVGDRKSDETRLDAWWQRINQVSPLFGHQKLPVDNDGDALR
jgi:hypothetical protein